MILSFAAGSMAARQCPLFSDDDRVKMVLRKLKSDFEKWLQEIDDAKKQ